MTAYEIHPAADLFPLMSDKELEGLVKDIGENGQREPATFWSGKLIDGRNRAIACERLGIELDACELDAATDPVKWVVSHNLHRRHLSPSQKSQVALKLKKLLEPEALEAKREGGKKGAAKAGNGRPSRDAAKLPQAKKKRKSREPASRDKAASMLGISGKLVDAAEKVEEKGIPELVAAVASGEVSVTRAAKIADAPKEQQAELISKPRAEKEESPLKAMIERNMEKLTIARYLFDSCNEQQRALISVAWSDWWKEFPA